MKQTIEELTVQLGFAKGKAKLYEKSLEEIKELKELVTELQDKLDQEKNVRQIMRNAITEHTTERDTVLEDMAREFYPDQKKNGTFVQFKDMKDMAAKCMMRFKGMRDRALKAERQITQLEEARKKGTNLQDYIVEVGNGNIAGYKAENGAHAAKLAQEDGHTVSATFTKEEYEMKKFL